MKLINFFIDELGSASLKATQSKIYILSGMMATSQSREELKIKADQIKFKYWNKTNIIFHSREIGRKEGKFKILKDEKINKSFLNDLIKFLKQGSYQLFGVVVDKQKIPKNWNEKTIYKKTSNIIIKNFIFSLLSCKGCKGRLVVESATAEKDFYYHKIAGHYLANGFKKLKINFKEVQNVLTEISFVTKKNLDIEEQIADILAYGLRLKYENKKNNKLNSYEQKLIKVVESKLFKMHPNTGKNKKKLHSQIESFKVIP
ncbi:DUF3800 domain-containing protein [Patescibacteria group bacterium]|nr:DUF3800 domain-containing protein [Patescibacteria group bacterium]